ncbi:MAG: alpha/beta fold hydrolase [Chloroflexi bacterium]|nr:alpha/beta fold hydrolase [Chloroflexota bacterium]
MTIPLPLLLIHGYNGTPADWTSSGFVDYLAEKAGLDPDLIELFHYGFVMEKGTKVYNNRGDIREIANRLGNVDGNGIVESLSKKGESRGGTGAVTIIAHSMGGLVARYFLSRSTPDRRGTLYAGGVDRLVEIGTPNLGTPLADVPDLVSRKSWLWGLLELWGRWPALRSHPAKDVARLELALRQRGRRVMAETFGETTIAKQTRSERTALSELHPGSTLLKEINRPGAMPGDIDYHCFYGDIRLIVSVRMWNMTIYRSQMSLGDLLVPASSARTIPGTSSQSHPLVDRQEITISVAGRDHRSPTARSVADYLPPVYHSNLLHNPSLHYQIGKMLQDGS